MNISLTDNTIRDTLFWVYLIVISLATYFTKSHSIYLLFIPIVLILVLPNFYIGADDPDSLVVDASGISDAFVRKGTTPFSKKEYFLVLITSVLAGCAAFLLVYFV